MIIRAYKKINLIPYKVNDSRYKHRNILNRAILKEGEHFEFEKSGQYVKIFRGNGLAGRLKLDEGLDYIKKCQDKEKEWNIFMN